MYTQEQIITALKTYHLCKSVTKTTFMLGYPTKRALYTWIKDEGSQKSPRKDLCNINTRNHPRTPSLEVKMNAIHRCFELGESIKLVSESIGYTRASIYTWRKRYLQGGTTALMNDKNIKPGTLTEGAASLSTPDIQQIQAQMKDMQLEIDLCFKKDPGIYQTALKNRKKAVIVDALKHR